MPAEPSTGAVRVVHGCVPANLIDDALRLLHVDLLENGVSAEQLDEWLWGAHWFGHLNHREEVVRLAQALPPEWQEGTRCDPQILLQFPHVGPEPEITFHVDEEPSWAQSRRYARIVGVPLSPWRERNGGLLVREDDEIRAVEIDPGDAVCLDPGVWHSGGVNRTGAIRYGIYFRWLQSASG